MFKLHMLRDDYQFTKDFHTHEWMVLYMVSLIGSTTIVIRIEYI